MQRHRERHRLRLHRRGYAAEAHRYHTKTAHALARHMNLEHASQWPNSLHGFGSSERRWRRTNAGTGRC
eukprot:8963815-Alexandrium_andersonii.AAC.1